MRMGAPEKPRVYLQFQVNRKLVTLGEMPLERPRVRRMPELTRSSFLPLPELHHLLSLPSSTSFTLTTLPRGVARLPARVPSSPQVLNAHSAVSTQKPSQG